MEVEKLRAEYDLEVDWRPFFLRPETPPEGLPLSPHILRRAADPNNPLKLRAQREGLKMVHSGVMASSRRAHEAVEFARLHGNLEPLHAALLRSYWERGEDLYAMETLRRAAMEAGLDPDALQAAIERGDHREQVERQVAEAQAMGIHAVPTFLIGDQYAIQGAQELLVFRQAMQRLGVSPKAKAIAADP